MIRKGLRPELKPGFSLVNDEDTYYRTLPFKRSWMAIAILAIMDVIFTIPLLSAASQAMTEWAQIESLFDLVAALFLSAWLLGWMTAPLIMTAIIVLMLFGSEVLRARPGRVEVFIGLPFVGMSARYDVTRMRNLRFEKPLKSSGKSWRGPHLAFDYGANTVAFGSDMTGDDLIDVRNKLQMATATIIRNGDALPDELKSDWAPAEESPPQLLQADKPIQNTAVSLASPSTLILITANLIPVAGSIFLGWNLADVMVLYWAESAVIGFFNICKMAVIGHWKVLFSGLFFASHFGGFMAVHFLFIYTIFVKQPALEATAGGDLAEVTQLFANLWPALLALFVSHAFSFYLNFLGRKEYLGKTLNSQMAEPYSRIIFMHLVLILGGGLTMVLGGITPVLIGVIGLKIYFDIRAHLKQR